MRSVHARAARWAPSARASRTSGARTSRTPAQLKCMYAAVALNLRPRVITWVRVARRRGGGRTSRQPRARLCAVWRHAAARPLPPSPTPCSPPPKSPFPSLSCAARGSRTCLPLCRRCGCRRRWSWGRGAPAAQTCNTWRGRGGGPWESAAPAAAHARAAPQRVRRAAGRQEAAHRMSRSTDMVRVWILKIWERDSRSGRPNSTCARMPAARVCGWAHAQRARATPALPPLPPHLAI